MTLILEDAEFVADLGFVADEKALDDDLRAKYADQLGDGDLLIAGWGANFEVDRENEAFAPGAFDNGLKTFLNGESTLCYHHDRKAVMGRVLGAEVVPGKGVRVAARVDSQPMSSPHRHLYEQVKKGSINALSFGGFFKRGMTPAGPRITDIDFTELSMTGVPVGRGTNFAVVAGKALADIKIPETPAVEGEIRESDAEQITYLIDELSRLFGSIGKRTPAGS